MSESLDVRCAVSDDYFRPRSTDPIVGQIEPESSERVLGRWVARNRAKLASGIYYVTVAGHEPPYCAIRVV